MKADEIISRPTATTGRSIVALAATILFVKTFRVEVDKLEVLGNIQLTGSKLDWVAFAALLYLGYAHLTNWAVDRADAPEFIAGDNYFGDHQNSWDGPNPPLRGRLVNAWIALRGGFGYSYLFSRVSLVYGLHMWLPAVLWLGAVVALLLV